MGKTDLLEVMELEGNISDLQIHIQRELNWKGEYGKLMRMPVLTSSALLFVCQYS